METNRLGLKDILNFVKFRIAFLAGISAITGFILASNEINFDILWLFVGILLLSGGAGGLNQVQEWKLDSIMRRTQLRPIPVRKISPASGLFFSLLLIFLGLLLLTFFSNNVLVPLFGLSAVVLYNFIYTPLKLRSPWASVPGAFIGSIPPYIGWILGGGELLHPQILALAGFFFVWQIPHFWLLLILFEDDYRKAGFPVLTDKLTTRQISRISFYSISILVILALAIPLFGTRFNLLSVLILFLLGVLLIYRSIPLLKLTNVEFSFRTAFVRLNFFVLLALIVFSINKIVG